MVGHAADGPGTDTHYITLKRSGTQVTGIAGPEDANWAIQDARLDGKKLTFQVAVPGSEMLLAYELQLTGDELAGTLEARKGPPVKGKLRLKRAKNKNLR